MASLRGLGLNNKVEDIPKESMPILVDTLDDLRSCLLKLGKATKILMDCEGEPFNRDGQCSVMQLKDLEGIEIFVVDVLKLGQTAFDNGLRDLLENTNIQKILWDCRTDSDVLKHVHHVTLCNVFDVQLLDVFILKELKGKDI
jgi:ribonuclease D